MSELYEKSIYKLELNCVLEQLAECAGSEAAKLVCKSLSPVSDLEDVQALLNETSAAVALSTGKGYPVFSGVHDIAASLERAQRGGSLSLKELLDIGSRAGSS